MSSSEALSAAASTALSHRSWLAQLRLRAAYRPCWRCRSCDLLLARSPEPPMVDPDGHPPGAADHGRCSGQRRLSRRRKPWWGPSGGSLSLSLYAEAPVPFVAAMVLWLGLCIYAAARSRNFVSYGFLLAGYSALLVGYEGATAPTQAWMIALDRSTEIIIGISCTAAASVLVDAPTCRRGAAGLARRHFLRSRALRRGGDAVR